MKSTTEDINTLKYKHVEDELRKLVRSSQLGEKLPPERKLAERLGCNVLTVRKGILPLVAEGLLSRRVGSGTFIAKLQMDDAEKNPRSPVPGMNHIGVLVHTDSDAYANRVLQALAPEALRQGTELRSTWTKTYDKPVMDSVKDMMRAGCKALILPWFPAECLSEVRSFVQHCPIPVVLPQIIVGLEHLCFEKPGVYGVSSKLEVEAVCDYFLKLGTKHILFIGPDQSNAPVLQERITAYVCHATKMGYEPSFGLFNRSPDGVMALAKREKKFVGDLCIISYDDAHAVRFMTAMHKIGLSAPKDYRIIGHNDTRLAWHADPPLTTIRQNFEYVGHALLKSALALTRGKTWQSDTIPNSQLVVRESCGSRDIAASLQISGLDIRVEEEGNTPTPAAPATVFEEPVDKRTGSKHSVQRV
jgi:DNA-binding LacI/PurR family transcriptional regulator